MHRKGSRASLRPVRRQREVIRDVMLSAGQCATWLTLEELARLTHYPPASISAQLRHLRKPRFGAFAVVKRSRKVTPWIRGEGFGTLWEYAVKPGPSLDATRRSSRRPRRRAAASSAAAPASAGRRRSSGRNRRRRKRLARRAKNL